MAIYVIIEYTTIENESMYMDYIKQAEPIVKKHKGEYIVRTNNVIPLSNNWKPGRIVIIKFPSRELMDRCFGSAEYTSLAHLRTQSTESRAIVVEGIS